MKIFIQLSIIFLIINPMLIVCSKKSSPAQVKKSKDQVKEVTDKLIEQVNVYKTGNPLKELVIYQNGIKTTMIRDAQTGKLVSSKTELNDGTIVDQVMDRQTGKKVSGTVTHPDGLTIGQTFDVNGKLIEQHIIHDGLALSDNVLAKSSVASKPKSVLTRAKDVTKKTVIKDAQIGKLVSSKTELNDGKIGEPVMDQQTGQKPSEASNAQEGLALLDNASANNELTSVQPRLSVASKPKSVSTIAADGREHTWESKSFDTKENSKVPDVAALAKANVKDPVVWDEIQHNLESKKFNEEVKEAFLKNPQVTQSFVSKIAWSKLIPTKTMRLSVDMISKFFKDLSLAFKEEIAEMELLPAEQDLVVRNERMQIQKIGKQINKITSNIKEKEMQLKQSEQELQAEKAKLESKPVWIAQHEKDIAQIKQTIEKQEQLKKSLQKEQTKLKADKFNDLGHLLVKSASQPVDTVIAYPLNPMLAVV